MPIQQMLLGAGAVATKTYIDDVFSTFLYTGTNSTLAINNGIDLATEGGMVVSKSRSNSNDWNCWDTERGVRKYIKWNSTGAEQTSNSGSGLTGFNSNGFTLGTNYNTENWDGGSGTAYTYTSNSFRKAKGFFTICEWTGNATNRLISHDLGCIPGLILIKRTDVATDWMVYHKSLNGGTDPGNYRLHLNTTVGEAAASTVFNNTEPTSTTFSIGSHYDVNGNNGTFVAYLFAGGNSTAATAKSVDFDGSGDTLQIAQHADLGFGTGDYTVEFWIKFRNLTTQVAQVDLTGATTADMWQIYNTADGKIHLYRKVSGSGSTILSSGSLSDRADGGGQWFHIAVTRASNTTRLYVNGTSVATTTDTTNYPAATFTIANRKGLDLTDCNCLVSNVRIVKGTAVYTSSFRPPTEPLTNITNTKLLCCNNSSTTGSTVTPGTITANGDPTASTDSPFDDPAAHVFGESGSESVIKCGSFTTNSNGVATIDLGWEPQWVLHKASSASGGWSLIDNMRGWPVEGINTTWLNANSDGAESNSNSNTSLTSTGFKVHLSSYWQNMTRIFVAIRRSDGYVGKPVELGTSVFAMDTGAASWTIPNFDSGFPVDMGLYRRPAVTDTWYLSHRLLQGRYLRPNLTNSDGGDGGLSFDSNVGWAENGKGSEYQSWQWKRHAGFDVVAFEGTNIAGLQIHHNLSKVPEMIWTKNRDATENWAVYHKGLNGGTNPQNYFLRLNKSDSEQASDGFWNDTAPTANAFTVGNNGEANGSEQSMLAILFASVDGISKVGSYSGSSSDVFVNLGFQPRFMIVKAYNSASGSQRWQVMDTLRGMAAGATATNRMYLDDSQAQQAGPYVTSVSSTGITLKTGYTYSNTNNYEYIYYAHA